MNPAFVDGLDEAARGLWRSAAESFADAMNGNPHHPAPVLAHATTLLQLDRADEAIVLLETSDALAKAGPEWRTSIAWLRCAARWAAADLHGVEVEAQALPAADARRVHVAVLFEELRTGEAITALLAGRRAERPVVAVRVDLVEEG